MALRNSMNGLIGRLRLLVADPDGATQTFGPDELQQALDRYQLHVRYEELTPIETREAGTGKVLYLTFFSEFDEWEEDAEVTDVSYNPLSPSEVDYQIGRWTFASSVTKGVVFATGKTYDLYAAAADLCQRMAAKRADDFDFSTSNRSYKRDQKFQHWTRLEADYRSRSRPQCGSLVRTDAA